MRSGATVTGIKSGGDAGGLFQPGRGAAEPV